MFAPYRNQHSLCALLVALALLAAQALLPASAPAAKAKPKPAAKAAPAFGLGDVSALAEKLAASPYQDPQGLVPEFLMKIDYDAWRDIRFRPEMSLWRKDKLPFEVQFFHPGLYYDRPVVVNVVDKGAVEKLPFNTAAFNYGNNTFADQIKPDLGFAGFRVHANINTPKYKDEVIVFLGASYFRAVAKDQSYGLSARGLAVDTAAPAGEEFPWFKEFWLVKPGRKDKSLTIYALLDSQSVAGAYAFTVTPGVETVVDVKSVLFPRANTQGKKFGIAPQTSMFLFGENSPRGAFDDFRPEVHDSDGLQIHFGSGEWMWRPLANPRTLLVNSFTAPDPAAFGLFQRDRDYNNYQDLESRYEKRPSVLVEPAGQWGPGRVELVQIPTNEEIHDNIVAYWVPEKGLEPGKPAGFDYRMRWGADFKGVPPEGQVLSTRVGKGKEERSRRFVVEFTGKALEKLPDGSAVNGVVSVGEGARLVEKQAQKNPATGGWRLSFEVAPDGDSPLDRVLPDKAPLLEVRAYLQRGMDVLTETWSYGFRP